MGFRCASLGKEFGAEGVKGRKEGRNARTEGIAGGEKSYFGHATS